MRNEIDSLKEQLMIYQ